MLREGWWSITYTTTPDDITLEYIGQLIKEGYTQGEMMIEEDDVIEDKIEQ